MKKFIYTFYLLCNLACICSCVNEEADLFDSSAAQRLNQAVTEYTDLLENSENGWIMDYYPSDGSLGGYTLTVVFKNGKSAIASEISYANDSGESWPAGTEVTSLYQVKAEQEVILTFDSIHPQKPLSCRISQLQYSKQNLHCPAAGRGKQQNVPQLSKHTGHFDVNITYWNLKRSLCCGRCGAFAPWLC